MRMNQSRSIFLNKKSILGSLFGLLLICLGCGDAASKKFALDAGDPVSVMNAVFAVARGDAPTTLLAELCDPAAKNDADTRRICAYADGFDADGEFPMFFAEGKINGDAEIREDTADVPFLYGPNGSDVETMKMIRREGKWYLFQF